MTYLLLALLLGSLLSPSNAFCYQKPLAPDVTHCLDDSDRTWHAVGSSWRNSRCMDCTCSGCCSAYQTPISFPPDCVSVLNLETCEYIVHKRDNPSIRCPIFGSIGK